MGLAVVGAGGYSIGRQSRPDSLLPLANVKRQIAPAPRVTLAVDQNITQLMINLCREIVKLPGEVIGGGPSVCNPGALVYWPQTPQSIGWLNSNVL